MPIYVCTVQPVPGYKSEENGLSPYYLSLLRIFLGTLGFSMVFTETRGDVACLRMEPSFY
jgi:hypothetical protein